nr:hypothetical protein [Sinorhizobium numidicum]
MIELDIGMDGAVAPFIVPAAQPVAVNHVTGAAGAEVNAALQAPVVVNLRVGADCKKGDALALPVQLAALVALALATRVCALLGAAIDKFLGLDVSKADSAENDEIAVVGRKQSGVGGSE